MTRQETKKIIAVMMISFPNYKPASIDSVIDIWTDLLNEYTYEKVNAALKAFILSDTSGFAPSIGQIIEKLQMLFDEEGGLNEMAAWQMVLKAMRNSIYHADEEFAKLPLTVQKAVVSPGQLHEWAMSENVDGTWMNVTQSNFMRTYRAETEKEKELQKLSPDLLKLTSRTAGQIALEGAKQEAVSAKGDNTLARHESVPLPDRLKEKYAKLMGQAV